MEVADIMSEAEVDKLIIATLLSQFDNDSMLEGRFGLLDF